MWKPGWPMPPGYFIYKVAKYLKLEGMYRG